MSSVSNDDFLLFPGAEDSASYSYVPRCADVQRTSDGKPLLSLHATGTTGFLMLTGEWPTREVALERLRRDLVGRGVARDVQALKLRPAPLDIGACRLVLQKGEGESEVLASSATSRVPPFSAVFNVALSAEQFALVSSALAGRTGLLRVEYEALVSWQVVLEGTLSADMAVLASRLRPVRARGVSALRAALNVAVAAGEACVSVSHPQAAEGDLSSLHDSLIERSIPLLLHALDAPARTSGKFRTSATYTRQARQRVRAEADIATLTLETLVHTPSRSGEDHAAD